MRALLEREAQTECSNVTTGRERTMEPMVIVLTFIAVATGLAALRAVAENRDSRRAIRVERRREQTGDIALARLRRAADTLRELR